MKALLVTAPMLLLFAGCTTYEPVTYQSRTLREAYDALVSKCRQPELLTTAEYNVVCFPGAQPDYLDCVVPAVRPYFTCDIRVHARAFQYYKPVLVGTVRITVEAGAVVASTVYPAQPIRVRTPHVNAITG